jgi:hypothetical protein
MSKTRNLANSAPSNVINAVVVPTGNTAQRPTLVPGYIRFNSDLNTLESANNTAWANVGSGSTSSSGGGVSWTPTVQNTSFIAVTGKGYFVNTAISTVTITLPTTPAVGDSITIVDYARTFTANSITLYPNGNKIQSNTANVVLNTNGQAVSLVYADTNQGWLNYSSATPVGPYPLEYLVVAGGGGGGNWGAGGAGAGGVLIGTTSVTPGIQYSVTVGGGGAAINNGTNSSLSSFAVAIGGGAGSNWQSYGNGQSGGSGGGATWVYSNSTGGYGTGTSGQGYPGGGPITYANASNHPSAGGGGAGGPGGNPTAVTDGQSGAGGVGRLSSIDGTSYYYAGGGGGGIHYGTGGAGGSGGGGGGGASTGNTGGSGGTGGRNNGGAGAANPGSGGSGGTNTGGGGGGGGGGGSPNAGAGGSGIVIVRYSGTVRGSGGTITASGGYTVHTFLSSGTFTA